MEYNKNTSMTWSRLFNKKSIINFFCETYTFKNIFLLSTLLYILEETLTSVMLFKQLHVIEIVINVY